MNIDLFETNPKSDRLYIFGFRRVKNLTNIIKLICLEEDPHIRSGRIIMELNNELQAIDKALSINDMFKAGEHSILLRKNLVNEINDENFPFKEVFHMKTDQVLLKILNEDINKGNDTLIKETLWSLSSLSLSPEYYLKQLVKNGIFQIVRGYLNIDYPDRVEFIYWILSNMLGNNMEYKILLDQLGFVSFLIDNDKEIIQIGKLRVVSSWFIGNLVRGKPFLNKTISFNLINTFKCYFKLGETSQAFSEMLWAICFLFEDIKNISEIIYFVHSLNIYSILSNNISKNNLEILLPTIRIIGKLSYSSENIITNLITPQFRDDLIRISISSVPIIACDSLWTISNICLTSLELCEFFYNEKFVLNLNQIIIDSNRKTKIRDECLTVLRSFFTILSLSLKENLLFNLKILDTTLIIFMSEDRSILNSALIFIDEILEFGNNVYNKK